MNQEAGQRHLGRRLRVAVVSSFYPNAVTPFRTVFIRNLVQAMRREVEIDVISPVPYAPPWPAKPQWQRFRGIPAHEDSAGLAVSHPRYGVVPGIAAISGLSYAAAIAGPLRQLARLQGVDVIHAHCAYPDAVGVALVARAMGIPYVVTAHGSDLNVYARHAWLRPQIRWGLARANAVIAVSTALEQAARRLVAADDRPLVRIPCSGYDPGVFHPGSQAEARDSLGVPQQARIVLFVGNLVPVKGVPTLLQAWQALRNRGVLGADDQLVLVGDGASRQALELSARQPGPGSSIRFLGQLPQDRIAGWMRAASVLCLPSLNEGMPNVIVEALASGLPVVASRVGGIPELLSDGHNGYLTPAGDVAKLSEALALALGHPWQPQQVAAGVQDLTWSALADRNIALLRAVTG